MSKCWICGKEMTTTIGGCEHCKDCGVVYNECVDELCKNGVGKGCYQDYNLLIRVLGWLSNYDCKEG